MCIGNNKKITEEDMLKDSYYRPDYDMIFVELLNDALENQQDFFKMNPKERE